MKNSVQKIYGLQYIRLFAIISVIVIHTLNSALIYFGDTASDISQLISQSVLSCIWWGVPCFLMITGWLLLNPEKEITYKKLFSKYILKMVLVLIVFAIPFTWMELIFTAKSINIFQLFESAYLVYQGKTWAHLWYIYALIGIYLLLPLFRNFVKSASDRDLKYICAVLIVFQVILPLLENLGVAKVGVELCITTVLPLWLLIGYMLSKGIIKISTVTATISLIISTGLLICYSVFSEIYGFELVGITGYSSIIVMAQAVSLFTLIFKIKLKDGGVINRFLLSISDASFGIYIFHMIIVNMVYQALKFNPYKYGILCFIALIIANLIISYIITLVLKRIPLIKKLL